MSRPAVDLDAFRARARLWLEGKSPPAWRDGGRAADDVEVGSFYRDWARALHTEAAGSASARRSCWM